MKLISITTVKVPIYLKGHESRESIRILGVTDEGELYQREWCEGTSTWGRWVEVPSGED